MESVGMCKLASLAEQCLYWRYRPGTKRIYTTLCVPGMYRYVMQVGVFSANILTICKCSYLVLDSHAYTNTHSQI